MYPTTSQDVEFHLIVSNVYNKTNRKFDADSKSLLRTLQIHINDYNARPFNFDYIHKFFDVYFSPKNISFKYIPLIFEELNRWTQLGISNYKRDEKRDNDLHILKSSKIYPQVYAKFKHFNIIRSPNGTRYTHPSLNQINDEYSFSPELESFISSEWEKIETEQQRIK